MTQPNEQLIETIQRSIKAHEAQEETLSAWHRDEELCSWLRALLEENKRLNKRLETLTDKTAELFELSVESARELEQVKAEREKERQIYSINMDEANRLIESLYAELSAKDKVLEWYADQTNYQYRSHYLNANDRSIIEDDGKQARSILQSYPPREKGAEQ